jgi:hypothetical protein
VVGNTGKVKTVKKGKTVIAMEKNRKTKGKEWLVRDFYRGWDAPEISQELNKLSADGWAVYWIDNLQDEFRLHKHFDDAPLTDGDYLSCSYTARVWLTK